MGARSNGLRASAMIGAAALLSGCFGYESLVNAVDGARVSEPPFQNGVYCAVGWDEYDELELVIDRSECVEFAWIAESQHYLVGELGLGIETSIAEIATLPGDEFLLQMSEEEPGASNDPSFSLMTGIDAEGGFVLFPGAPRDELEPLLAAFPDVQLKFGQYGSITILEGAPESIRSLLAQADEPWREAVRRGEADWAPYRDDPGPLWFIRVNDVHTEDQELAALDALGESVRATLGAPDMSDAGELGDLDGEDAADPATP